MPAQVCVLGMYSKVEKQSNTTVVNTTSKAADWQRDLSPFHLGPCPLYGGHVARRMENAWQYSKVYAVHAGAGGAPNAAYWAWAKAGWAAPKPVRYPMGRGARPLYSLWAGTRLGYIAARKAIYAPLYARAVQGTAGWAHLVQLYQTRHTLVLRDYDGYDHTALGLTLRQVLNSPARKMGHAFVLAMLLTRDPALEEITL